MVFDRHFRSVIKDSIIIFAGVSSFVAVSVGFLGIPAKVSAQEADIKLLKEFKESTAISLQALQKDFEYQKIKLQEIDKKIELIISYQRGRG